MDSVNEAFGVVDVILIILLGLEFKRTQQLSTLNRTFYTASSFHSKILIEKRANQACISSIDRLLKHRIENNGPLVEEFKILFDDNRLDKALGNVLKKLFKNGVRKITLIYEGNGYSTALTGVINDSHASLQSLSITKFKCPVDIRKLSSLESLTLVNNCFSTSTVLDRICASLNLNKLVLEGYSVAKQKTIPAVTLGHVMKFYFGFGCYPKLLISTHNSLTHLNLTSTTVSDQQLYSSVLEMPNLLYLSLSQCSGLQQPQLSSGSVVTLVVTSCNGIVKLSLTTPRLEFLTYHTAEFHRPLYFDTAFAHANNFSAHLTLLQRNKGYDKEVYFRALQNTLAQFNNPITLTLEFLTEQHYQEMLNIIQGLAGVTVVVRTKKSSRAKILVTLDLSF